MTLACTICNSPDVLAIRPGQDAVWSDDNGPLLPRFMILRPVPDECWCLACMPRRRK